MSTKRIKTMTVLISGYKAGTVSELPNGKYAFEYDPSYINGHVRIPISLSMPMVKQRHEGPVVEAFLWGLLPDNQITLDDWGRRFQVSSKSAFQLLSAVGHDCAGAIQFTHEQKADRESDVLIPLTDEDIENRLTQLKSNSGATRQIGEGGQFSLAGAQSKTAYYQDPATKKWYIPTGNIPTTHIFKPPSDIRLDGQAENEHFCLKLARKLGLNSASSQVISFGKEKAIVVERYDRRLLPNGTMIRIHQEDHCQALGISSLIKYENQGGPGISKICNEVLNKSNSPSKDRQDFMAANIFNFLIGGTDAHGKNYSMLIGRDGECKLAPLYDIASILPHIRDIDESSKSIKLAMKVGKKYHFDDIMPRHWEREASASRVSPKWTISEIRRQIEEMPDALHECLLECKKEGLDHPVLERLVDLISFRAVLLKRFYAEDFAEQREDEQTHQLSI